MVTWIALILLIDVILTGFAFYVVYQARNTRKLFFYLESEYIVYRAKTEQAIKDIVRDEVAKIDADNRRMDHLESKIDKASRLSKSNVVQIARKEIQRNKKKGSRKISPVVSSWSARDRFEKKLLEERLSLKKA